MSFADQVQAAVETAESSADTERAQRYRAVLNELCAGLERLGVGARINPLGDPRRFALFVHAPDRPQRGSLMLTFFVDEDAIVVSGETPTRIEAPEALERWLLDFVKLPAFVESIRALREAASEPVEARLRVNQERAYAKGDVLVEVSPTDQRKLAEATAGARVELEVERVEFPGNAQFTTAEHYPVLDSAGLVVNVDSVTQAGEKLRVVGRRAA
jgi:hypothetical protein